MTTVLPAGITPAGQGQDGTVWNVLGHVYYLKSSCESSFAFETLDPPGSFVPPHVHPDQDEFIYVLEGVIHLKLDEGEHTANVGDLIRLPRGIPHGYANNGAVNARALFWVSPAGSLRELFAALHDLTDMGEAVRLSALHGVDFLPPP